MGCCTWIDRDADRVASDAQAVDHLDDPRYLADALADRLRPRFERPGIIAEELHLDRLGDGGQIPNQILHQLDQLDFEPRHLGCDLLAHAGHHRLDIAPRAALEPDEIIALIGFGQAAAELHPGAPRIARHFRGRADDCLDTPQQGVGILERCTRLGLVVEDEAAFIHLRHESRRDIAPSGIAAHRQQRPDDGRKQDRPAKGPRARATVAGEQRVKDGVGPVGGLRVLLAQPMSGDQGNDEAREEQGNEQRSDHRDGQRLEKAPGHPADEGQGKEDDDRCHGRSEQRHAHFGGSAEERLRIAQPLLLHPPHHMFEHHHRIVDDKADGGRHAAQRHHVEAHAEREEKQTGCREDGGQHQPGDDHQPSRTEEDEEHDSREHRAHENRIPHRIGRAYDQFGLIVEGGDLDRRRQAERGEARIDRAHDRHCVAFERLADVDQHCLLAVRGHPAERRSGRGRDRRDLPEGDNSRAACRRLDRDCREIACIGDAVFEQDEIETVPILDLAETTHHIGLAERRHDVAQADAERLQPRWIDLDRKFTGAATEDIYAGNAFDRGQRRQDLEFRKGTKRLGAKAVGGQGKAGYRKDRGIRAPDVEARPRRQGRQQRGKRALRRLRRGDHIVAPLKVECDFGAAAARDRADPGHARDGAQPDLDRAGDLGFHLRRVAIPGIDRDDDARIVDVGEEPDGNAGRGYHAGEG